MARKPSRGRQKIPMVKMQNENSLNVTFSKRRFGIMKKVNDLCTVTGAEVAIIIFSPGNKPYSFGNPSVESVLNKFQNLTLNLPSVNLTQSHKMDKIDQLKAKIENLNEQIETEEILKETLDHISENEGNNLEDLIEGKNLEQLQTLKLMFSEIKQRAEKEMNKLKNLEKMKEDHFQLQNADIEKASGYMPNFAIPRNEFGFSQGLAVPSTFGGGFNFTRGEASGSRNNGIDLNVPVAPPVDSFVVLHNGAANGYGL